MYIQRNKKKTKNKVYTSTLLVESYRSAGKVKHKTLLNISKWKPFQIEALEKGLKKEPIAIQSEPRTIMANRISKTISYAYIYQKLQAIDLLRNQKKTLIHHFTLVLIDQLFNTAKEKVYAFNEKQITNIINDKLELIKIEEKFNQMKKPKKNESGQISLFERPKELEKKPIQIIETDLYKILSKEHPKEFLINSISYLLTTINNSLKNYDIY